MEIKSHKNPFEALFHYASEGILLCKANGIISIANQAACTMFGYQEAELIGQSVEILIPKKITALHQEHRKKFIRNAHARSMGIGMDLYGLKKDGNEFPVEISLSPFEDDGEQFVIAFIIDITQRKQIENAVLKHKEELELAALQLKSSNEALEGKVNDRTKVLLEALNALEKSKKELSEALKKEKDLNELKSRFLSMASHEFRTPLTTILSSASLIEEYPNTDQNDKRLRHVERIKSAVTNLNDILSDFISISRIEEGKVIADIRNFNLKNLADEMISELRYLFKHGQVIKHFHTGVEDVHLDLKMTRNVIINLLSNAIKFSPENSPIELITKVDKNGYLIEIKDQGIGISNEDKKHLFERFFRGHNASNVAGTGLGLNIVANYVDLMGGRITFDSELNKGTTIKINFNIKDVMAKSNL